MKAIYACKLYKSSPRKDKIRCAIENPVNAELVAQLAEHLDEEYQSPAYLSKGGSQLSDSSNKKGEARFDESNTESSFSAPGGHASVPSSGGFDIDESFDTSDGDTLDIEDGGEVLEGDGLDEGLEGTGDDSIEFTEGDADNPDDDIPIQEATDIETSEEDDDSKSSPVELTVESANSLKEILNTSPEVAGVDRAQIKDNEVWFYYNDSVNLNNVMTPVIELISNSGYALEFNRLARSVNAIVFQIGSSVSPEVIEYESETA